MQSPDELTVTEFEQAEHGLSVVLTNAIEDQRAVVEYIVSQVDADRERAMNAPPCEYWEKRCRDGGVLQFQAMRVLGLLEATREREAGQVT